MESSVQIISRNVVKPASPTPSHLKTVKLSYLDQLMFPVYVPLVFFYQADESKGLKISNQARICQQMKHSLSDILTAFYPLAGSVDADNLAVDCCDAGVEFVEARSRCNVSEAMDSSTEKLKQLCPMDHAGPGERPIFNVQLTLFDCGGIAVGVYYSHVITDCNSLLMFLNAWAAACRGNRSVPRSARFDLADHFPPRQLPSSNFWGEVTSEEKLIVRKFVFGKEILSHLRKEAVSSPGSRVGDPTRVELISAFAWKHFWEMEKLKNPNSRKNLATLHAVNLRGRKAVLGDVYGNCVMSAFSFAADSRSEIGGLVSELRRSIRRFDEDYITEAQRGSNYLEDLYGAYSVLGNGETEVCVFTSWCRCPIYDIDYGFGGPVLFRTPAAEMKNYVLLSSSRFGDDIEALICAEEDTLEMLQTKINLISH